MTNHDTHICSFPTTTVIVDDNEEFLNSIALKLDKTRQSYKYFTSAHEATKFIKDNYHKSRWFLKYIQNIEEAEQDRKLVEFNLKDLYKQVYDQERFDIITTVISDYDMPEITGLEMFSDLHDAQLHKVLLTGVVDEKVAVKAFNDKAIDAFIPKSHPDIYSQIHKVIEDGSNNYFADIGYKLLEPANKDLFNSIYNNSVFTRLFDNLMKDHDIVEYYMTSTDGSFLLISKSGQYGMFFIYSEEHLESLSLMAKEEDFAPKYQELLDRREKMLCFYGSNEQTIADWNDCQKYLQDCTKIEISGTNYYYSYVKNIGLNKEIIGFAARS